MSTRYTVMGFACQNCQHRVNQVDEVGVTDNLEMRFEWKCPRCYQQIAVIAPFENLAKMAPKPPEPEMTEYDRKFLATAHISGLKDEGKE